MSLLPFFLMGASKSGGLDSDLPGLVLAPYVFIGKAFEKFETFKQKIKDHAERKSNISAYKEITEQYKKLSEGKVGTVQRVRDEKTNTEMIVIHTENGPFVKTTQRGSVVYDRFGKESRDGVKTTYSGIREMSDKDGNTFLAYIDDVSVATSSPYIDGNHNSVIGYHTGGSVLTETGVRDSFEDVTRRFEEQPELTGGVFDLVKALEQNFQEELARHQQAPQQHKNKSDEPDFQM